MNLLGNTHMSLDSRNSLSRKYIALGAILLLAAPICAFTKAVAVDADCDRNCLRSVLDTYMRAVFAHDPSKAELAVRSRATVNAAELVNGTGIWLSATGLGSIQRRYFDTTNGQAVYFGIITEGAEPAIASLRIKIVTKKVTEAEWIVAREKYGDMFSSSGLIDLPPPQNAALPKQERTSRRTLIEAADRYFEGLQIHDGSRVPHVAGCERVENGVRVTNRKRSEFLKSVQPAPRVDPLAPTPKSADSIRAPMNTADGAGSMSQEARAGDCTSGFDLFANTIAETSHRRYAVIDEDAGVVMASSIFHRPPGVTLKRNLLSEFFWEKRGKIVAIYAAMFYLDPMAADTPGW